MLLGKIIGGVFGYLITNNIWGILIGVFLGHQFDRGLSRSGGGFSAGWRVVNQARAQQAFFETTFSVMGHLAKADGRVSEEEIALARQVMARMGLPEAARREAIRLFGQGKAADFDLDAALAGFRSVTLGQRNLLQMFLEIQFFAAYADGAMDPDERRVLLHVCESLGFSQADFDRLDAMIQAEMHGFQDGGKRRGPSLEDAYAILNISEDASDSEVKKAYRRLMSQHHPDKLVAKGLPEEMMKLAQEKTHEIRTAYERIKEARGF
ncbi:MAG TPA: co-chaperone DjlA [Gammaproteobacteria bacterium]|nr:co-chaperone DjlA [Gammaproteobacteria bacterium]